MEHVYYQMIPSSSGHNKALQGGQASQFSAYNSLLDQKFVT